MSMLQRGCKLMLSMARQSSIRYFRSAPVLLNADRTQSEFTGLENCFIWDDQHGFGFSKDGEVVIVTPSTFPTQQVFNSESFNMTCTSPEFDEEIPEDGQVKPLILNMQDTSNSFSASGHH